MQDNRTVHSKPFRSDDYLVMQNMIVGDAASTIIRLMENEGVSRSELARRLHWNPARVSQVLNHEHNFRLKTFSDMAYALGYQIKFTTIPIKDVK